jgi:signal peptidase II
MADPSPGPGGSSEAPPDRSRGFAAKLAAKLFKDKVLFWILVLVFVSADLWTKQVAISHVHDSFDGRLSGGSSPVVWVKEPWFGLVSVENKGGPWGVGAGISGILKIVRFAALGVILYLLAATPRKARLQITALAMIMGGAVGNIWDTIAFGSVRDFLYFDLDFAPADPWPAFNLADSLICSGVVLLAVVFFFEWLRDRKRAAPAAAGGTAAGDGSGAVDEK